MDISYTCIHVYPLLIDMLLNYHTCHVRRREMSATVMVQQFYGCATGRYGATLGGYGMLLALPSTWLVYDTTSSTTATSLG